MRLAQLDEPECTAMSMKESWSVSTCPVVDDLRPIYSPRASGGFQQKLRLTSIR